MKRLWQIIGLWVASSLPTLLQAQPFPKATAEQIKAEFNDIHRKLLEMAKDFPSDKYNYRLKPEMRSFGEVIVHVASGVEYAAKAGRGDQVKWDELNAKNYPNKTAAVALLEEIHCGCRCHPHQPADSRFRQNGGALGSGAGTLGRTLRPARGVLPGERTRAAGIASAECGKVTGHLGSPLEHSAWHRPKFTRSLG